MPCRALGWWLLAAAAMVQPAPALDPTKAFHQYRLDVWQSRQGLPQSTPIALAQTKDGYLWLGGYDGLTRFDGVRFAHFERANTPGLGDDNIFALRETADGSLWIGTDGGGLTRLQNGRFTTYTTADGLVDNRVQCLAESRDGDLWIGTKGGLSRFEAGRFESYTRRDGLPDNFIQALAGDRDGSLWIGTEAGLARLEGGTVSAYGRRDGLGGDDVSGLAVDRSGTVWIGVYGGPLSYHREGAFSHLDDERSANAVSFLEDSDGSLWIGTYGGGLLRLRGERLDVHGPDSGLTSDLVWALVEDREGSVWIGAEGGGLQRLKDVPVTPFTRRDGLPHERVLVVYEDSEGILWIGTDGGGLAKLEDGAFTTYTARDGLASDFVTAVHRRRDGSLWIGTVSGLSQLRNGRFTSDFAAELGPSARIRAVFEDRQGRMWIGTDNRGLVSIEGTSLTAYTAADGLPGNGVRVLAEDRHGALWIGVDGGLARLLEGEITVVEALAGAFVRAIYEDPEGALWIGTRGQGLTRIRNGEATTFTLEHGLYDDIVYQILEDGGGNLWMSCNKGIFRVARDELNAVARGVLPAVRATAFDDADGMPTPDCAGGSQPAGWKTRDGRLWFPTPEGLAVVDPARLEPNDLPPPVYVERVLADGAPLAGVAPGASLTLPPGRGELEIQYTALSLLVPERVRCKYRLAPYDETWVDAGARRTAYYTNIPPGRYRFEVIASNNDGVWNEEGDRIDLHLRPAFHQTWAFYLTCAAAALLLVRSLHRLRVRSLIRRNEALRGIRKQLEAKNVEVEAKNAEIERFTYAVSHDLKSPLVTILGFLGFLERDLAAGNADKVASDVERIRGAATRMRRLIDELLELSRLGRIVHPHESVDLGELAREAVEVVGGQIDARGVDVVVSDDLPVVSGDRSRLFQVLQNLLDNAVKFMGDQSAPRIEIGTVRTAGAGRSEETVCYVRDNGVGIDPRYHAQVFGLFDKLDAQAEGAGLGLALVHRILEIHGGRIWVESEGEGRGSTFFFALPAEPEPAAASASP